MMGECGDPGPQGLANKPIAEKHAYTANTFLCFDGIFIQQKFVDVKTDVVDVFVDGIFGKV
jgi:hypothetical protein